VEAAKVNGSDLKHIYNISTKMQRWMRLISSFILVGMERAGII
jgi:hypothetical protein